MTVIFLTVFLFFLISILLFKISDKLFIQSIHKKYPNETIIHNFKPPMFITLIIPFLMCALPGCIVVPYLLINGIIDFSVSISAIFIFVFMVIPACVFSVCQYNLFKNVITNKRVTNGKNNSLLYNKVDFLLEDIKALEWHKPHKAIIATFKNNEMLIFAQFMTDKELFEKIKSFIFEKGEK